MEEKINYGAIARYLTVVFGLVMLLLIGLALLVGKYHPLGETESIIITLFFAIFLPYFFVAWAFRKNFTKWNIAIVSEEDGSQRIFGGPAFISLYFGFIWRTIIVGIILNAIGSLIKTMYGDFLDEGTANMIKFIIYILNIYFSFYWLLLAQYGAFKIKLLTSLGSKNNVTIENNANIIKDMNTSIKTTLVAALTTFTVISFFVLSIVQIFAIYDFFKYFLEWNALGSFFAAVFIGPIPIVGSLAGVISAIKLWHWQAVYAILLFFYPIALYLAILILGGSAAIFQSIFKK